VQPQFGAQLLFGIGDDVEGSQGLGARLQGLLRFNDYFAAGVEVSLFLGAGSSTTYSPGGGDDSSSSPALLPVFSMPLRIGVDRGELRPALVLAPVAMAHEFDGGIGFAAGVELAFPTGRVPVVFDARYYKRLSGSSGDYPIQLSLGLGTRF
jgi:hypothetical protein